MSGVHVFTLAGVPVRVSPWFFALLAYYGMSLGSLQMGLLFGLAVSVSLLVHEMGHALMAKRFGLGPEVLIHGWGGLCAHRPAARDRDDALIVAAGPGAGLALGGLVFLAQTVTSAAAPGLLYTAAGVTALSIFFKQMLFINIFWSLINLVPLFPLDGGQLYRLGLLRVTTPAKADRATYLTGATLAGAGLIWAYTSGSLFLGLIAAFLAYENIQRLRSGRAGGAIRTGDKLKQAQLVEARAALNAGDPREAARLCHVLRGERELHQGLLDECWTILAVATVALGEHDEALTYIQRAPRRAEVIAAAIRAYVALGEPTAAHAELADPELRKLPQAEQEALATLVARAGR